MLKGLLERQKNSLDAFFHTVDLKRLEEIFAALASCEGSIVFSGVGKSGHIGRKLSSSLLSMGIPSSFLSPSDALHGDLGILSSKDCLIFLSKSGASEELLSLCPHLQARKVFSIAWVCEKKSPLESRVDLSLHLPLDRELCSHNLAPTTSSILQLLIGDLMAVALMERKGRGKELFAQNHPGGWLGKRISMKVLDWMKKGDDLPLCSPETPLIDLLHKLSSKQMGCLLICDENKHLKGIFTDGDLRRALEKEGKKALDAPIATLMTTTFLSIDSEALIHDAMVEMERSRSITVLPVVDQQQLVGLLRMHDIVQRGILS